MYDLYRISPTGQSVKGLRRAPEQYSRTRLHLAPASPDEVIAWVTRQIKADAAWQHLNDQDIPDEGFPSVHPLEYGRDPREMNADDMLYIVTDQPDEATFEDEEGDPTFGARRYAPARLHFADSDEAIGIASNGY